MLNIPTEIIVIVSIMIGAITFGVSRTRFATPEYLTLWYAIVAGIILLAVLFSCAPKDSQGSAYLLCFKNAAPWFVLLAAHALLLSVYLDKDKRLASILAKLIRASLVLLAAYLYVFLEPVELILLALVTMTVPLFLIVTKGDQDTKDANGDDSYADSCK